MLLKGLLHYAPTVGEAYTHKSLRGLQRRATWDININRSDSGHDLKINTIIKIMKNQLAWLVSDLSC